MLTLENMRCCANKVSPGVDVRAEDNFSVVNSVRI